MNNNEIDVLDQIKNAKQDLRLKHEETEKELKEPIIALYRKVDTFLLALAKTLLEREPFHSFILRMRHPDKERISKPFTHTAVSLIAFSMTSTPTNRFIKSNATKTMRM